MKLDVDEVIKEVLNLKQGQEQSYYDNLYIKTQNILNGNYSIEDKQKLNGKGIGMLEALYMLSSYSVR